MNVPEIPPLPPSFTSQRLTVEMLVHRMAEQGRRAVNAIHQENSTDLAEALGRIESLTTEIRSKLSDKGNHSS